MRTTFTGLLLQMFLYFTVVSAIPAPDNFTILSDNFKHILKWTPGKNSSPQTVFNIKQRCSSEKPIDLLSEIRNTTVDVSKSLENIYKPCTFLLWASLDNMNSSKVKKRITPFEDTVIGPPMVVLSGCGDCLKINISLPRGSGRKKQLDQFYNSVSFNISWKKAEEKKANHVHSDGDYVLQNLQPGEKYCIRVNPITNVNRNTQSSDWQCEYTSREAQREVLYLASWSLGAVSFGLGVLVLAGILFYIGCLYKLKTLPEALSNIVQTYYLNPEQTMTESVLLTDAQLKMLKCYPTKNSPLLNLDYGPPKEQHEDDDNVGQKADTDDDEEENKEDEEDNCTYMDRIINHSSLKTTEIGENCIVSSLPLLYSSGISYTGNKIPLHFSVTRPSQHIQIDEDEYKEEVMTGVSRENQNLSKFRLEPEGNADGSDATGDINLLSVTFRSFGPEEDGKDCDKKELCKLQEFYTIPPSVQTEEKTEDPITKGNQKHFSLCSHDSDIETNQASKSGYTATYTGGMHKQNSCTTEETDYFDTGYITR
ncbi:cytokine receptor family member b1 isoform X1 [Paramisgurnus dabryanus]|uniref:cytokine receptor family member b1 isoform X1 n=3 Tax=Paramisgurnus dabryanus TaxID=90735 RepID=UPI0031F33DC6